MSKNSWHISSNSSEYGSEPFPDLLSKSNSSSEPYEGEGTWKNVSDTIRGGLRTRTRRRRTRKSRKSRKSRKTRR